MSQNNVEHTQYKRVKLLGEGSYGKAYLVKNLSDDSLCVIKQLDISNMSDKEKKDTYNEAKVLKSLNHPCIVHFREVYKTKRGKLCIVMDYADGGDLAAKIRAQNGKHFAEAQILDWFTQICLGLKHVHDRKILHRDLKSQNIFLTKTNLVKLGDFGIAKVLSGTQELAMTVIGTPYYLSPELIDGKPYNFKSDIWALGVLLYELCTLHHPFDANGFPMLARKIVKGRYTPLPATFSKDLRDLVHSLLSVNPQDRPSINAILKKDVIQNRIKNFLDETIRAEEFSHTILHHKVIKLDHVHFEKKSHHSKQTAGHPKIIFTVTKTRDQQQQQIIIEPQENHRNNKTSPSDSPIVRPVIHHRKPVAHLPLVFGNVPSYVPANQIRSPTANPIRSPAANPGHVLKPSPASKSKDHKSPRSLSRINNHILPEIENKLRPNPELPPLVTNSILTTTKESPNLNSQISLSYVGISHNSPDLHLPNLNKQRLIPQPKSAQSKENRGHFEINKIPKIHAEDNTPSSKVGLKREALKGFEKISPKHIEKGKSHLELLPKKLDFGSVDMIPSHQDGDSTKHSDASKRNEKELRDIQAMVSELNKVIMNLDHQHQVDIVDHFDLKHEIEKDVERDDDPEEPHHEIDEIPPPPVKLQKENSYIVDRKSLEELREKLSQNLSDDKFFKAYTLAKEMVENDQDMHLMEEGVEYHMKMFPFLSREEVSNSLFDVFTFVVMEDWIRTKNLQ